jgi:uncharacterized surface protein with fasciclin (FAS1) repeats
VVLVSAITALTVAAVVWALWSRDGPRDGSGDGSAGVAGSSSAGATATGSGGGAAGTAAAPRLPPGAVGSGCADYAAAVPTGPGSLSAMAREPVAAAIAGSPLLHTFDQALTGGLNRRVDLTAELRRGAITVFAPVDSALALVPADRMALLRRDAARLRALLRSHLVTGRLDPDQVLGAHRTLAGTTLQVTGSGGGLTANGAAVLCGGLRTSNATVYLIGQVLS